jgi:hypothetical protein
MSEQQKKPRRRWFHFSLRTLFLVVTFVVPAPWVIAKGIEISCAATNLALQSAAFECDAIDCRQFVAASRRLRDAQASVPFCERWATSEHLERIAKLDREIPVICDPQEAAKRVELVNAERRLLDQ